MDDRQEGGPSRPTGGGVGRDARQESRDDPTITIRPATRDDLAPIIDLASDAIVHSISPIRGTPPDRVATYRREDLGSLQRVFGSPNLGLFVAEGRGGELVGHIIVVANLTEQTTGEIQGMILDLSVKRSHWGTGVADRLMAEGEAFCREKGMEFVELGVTSANLRAVRFYEKMGYLEERKRMVKRLSPDGP